MANIKLPGRVMLIPIGAKPNKFRTFSVLPQSDMLTTPCDLFLNGEEIFHQTVCTFRAAYIIQIIHGTSEATACLESN